MKPQIATILQDGTYGQREMTDEEYLEMQANAPKLPHESEPANDASKPS